MRDPIRRARFSLDTTMVNRLKYLTGHVPEATSYTDYYLVETLSDTFIVPLSTALAIERQLDKAATPDWLEFRDVFGARHRVLALCVYRITESTRETRSALCAFQQERRKEEKQHEDPYSDLD